jgi:hypothetical protein
VCVFIDSFPLWRRLHLLRKSRAPLAITLYPQTTAYGSHPAVLVEWDQGAMTCLRRRHSRGRRHDCAKSLSRVWIMSRPYSAHLQVEVEASDLRPSFARREFGRRGRCQYGYCFRKRKSRKRLGRLPHCGRPLNSAHAFERRRSPFERRRIPLPDPCQAIVWRVAQLREGAPIEELRTSGLV